MNREARLYEVLGIVRESHWVNDAIEEAGPAYSRASRGLTCIVSDAQDDYPHIAGSEAFAFIAGPFISAVVQNVFVAGYMLGLQSGEKRQIRDEKLRLMLEKEVRDDGKA